LIAVEIEALSEAWSREAMSKGRATVVAKAARACLQEGEPLPPLAMLAVAVRG